MSEEASIRCPVKPGDVVGGKYRVDRILGAGGMGVVVAATHTELDQAVALKFILPESLSGKDAIERFMREARSVAKLKSEHVARVYDVGRDEQNNPYMVLELLEGLDLAKLNKTKGPFAIADSVEYVLQACEALVEAHTAGIVHRDLKPQNLFVGRRLNGMPLVKVLDFGIAKAVGAAAVGQMALTDSQAVIGSPLYMAPEHMRSARAADTRSDIWSLGVILYELLGGQLPFDGETVTEVCIRVVNEAPPSLLSLRPGLDASLVAVVMKCLEKDAGQRWQNVAQLATALEPFSRSGQHGGAMRPWRSFDDTQDSANRPGPGPGSMQPWSSGRAITPDDTGPSTAITMPTVSHVPPVPMTPMPGSGGGTLVANGMHTSVMPSDHSPNSSMQRPLVSTDTAWGNISDARASAQARPRSFTKGLAVGIVLSLAAAAAIVFAIRNQQLHRSSTAASAPAVTTSAVAVAAPPPSVSEPPPPASTPVAATALPNASVSVTVPPPVVKGRRTKAAPPATTSVAPAPAPAPTPHEAPKPSETQSPNGAPILR